MRQRVAAVCAKLGLIFLLLTGLSAQASVNAGGPQGKPFKIAGSLIIEFDRSAPPASLQRGFGAVNFGIPSVDVLMTRFNARDARNLFPWRKTPPASADQPDLTRYYELVLPESANLDQIREGLLQNPNISNVFYNWAMPVAVTPDDPDRVSQWHASKIQLESAWDLEAGSDSIKIAIIDTGVNYLHPDLKNNIWVNPGEDLDGDGEVYDQGDLNGIDDDGNGVVDDLIGYDFFTGISGGVKTGEDGSIPDSDPNDFDGHGTHCAGIAAAVTNNATDVVGVAGGWGGGHRSYRGPRIMCLRAGGTGTDNLGYVNSANVATAIDYAVANGAHIISMSFGGSAVQITPIAGAITAGLTLLHAAGNDNVDSPDELDGFGTAVLSVASTTISDTKSSFSNFGDWVDVSAPGSGILSTFSNEYVATTAELSGTSMAAPMVAGVAALIRSAMPSLSKAAVDSIIMATVDTIDYLNPSYALLLGTGRINAYKALADLAIARFTSDATDGQVPLTVNFTDQSPNSPTTWDWTFGDGGSSTDQNPSHEYTVPGVYDVSLVVNDANGVGEEHLKRYVWAQADSMSIDSLEVDPGTVVDVPFYLTNTAQVKNITLSFSFPNAYNVKPAGLVTAGTRSEDFAAVTFTAFDNTNKRYTVALQSSAVGQSNYLPPGSGPIMVLQLNVPSSVPPQTVIKIDTASWTGNQSNIETILGDYLPADIQPGYITIAGCCVGQTGNVNGDVDDIVDISDLTALVNFLFVTFNPLSCPEEANTNGDSEGVVDISDLTALVNNLFVTFNPLPNCQ